MYKHVNEGQSQMINVNDKFEVLTSLYKCTLLLTFWQYLFLFRIKYTFVFCLSFLNETKINQLSIKKIGIKVLAIDSRLSIVIA